MKAAQAKSKAGSGVTQLKRRAAAPQRNSTTTPGAQDFSPERTVAEKGLPEYPQAHLSTVSAALGRYHVLFREKAGRVIKVTLTHAG